MKPTRSIQMMAFNTAYPLQNTSAAIQLLKKMSLIRIYVVGSCVILKLEKESLIISTANTNVTETWLVL